MPWGSRPPKKADHPQEADTPPKEADTPLGGTHATGMHTCEALFSVAQEAVSLENRFYSRSRLIVFVLSHCA